jgi:hypothetical protein
MLSDRNAFGQKCFRTQTLLDKNAFIKKWMIIMPLDKNAYGQKMFSDKNAFGQKIIEW